MCGKRPPVSRGTGLLILSAAAAAGCDRPAPQPNGTAAEPAFDVYDSAGVEIVVNHAPQRPRGQFWTIDPEPAFVLGETRLPGRAPEVRITAGNRLKSIGTARSAFPAVGLDPAGPCPDSGKTGIDWRECPQSQFQPVSRSRKATVRRASAALRCPWGTGATQTRGIS